MTQQEILLVASLAGLAVAITLADLLLSLVRHIRRDRIVPHPSSPATASPGVATSAPGESATRRLAAIEAATEVEQW